jgi:hypothetical protein
MIHFYIQDYVHDSDRRYLPFLSLFLHQDGSGNYWELLLKINFYYFIGHSLRELLLRYLIIKVEAAQCDCFGAEPK